MRILVFIIIDSLIGVVIYNMIGIMMIEILILIPHHLYHIHFMSQIFPRLLILVHLDLADLAVMGTTTMCWLLNGVIFVATVAQLC